MMRKWNDRAKKIRERNKSFQNAKGAKSTMKEKSKLEILEECISV